MALSVYSSSHLIRSVYSNPLRLQALSVQKLTVPACFNANSFGMISANHKPMASISIIINRLGGHGSVPIRRTVSPQASCQNRLRACKGFTLIELLVVIVIIGLLGSALVVSVQSSYKQARQANCKSNLRQFGVALTIYRGEHDNQTPPWISNLYPDYVDDRGLYICRADKNGGTDRPRPEDLVRLINDTGNSADQSSYWDNQRNGNALRNQAITCCSYFYEFSVASAKGWYGGDPLPAGTVINTMSDFKTVQLRYGDQANIVNGQQMPYSASRVPIVRCYHHFRDQKVLGYQNSGGKKTERIKKDFITINVAYAGNVFVGPTWWEGTIYPGESPSSSP
jgi:prepilin-type N-terminal cleavage/methylation domain-containing protein